MELKRILKLGMGVAMALAFNAAAQDEINLLKGTKVPDAKLSDGVFATSMMLGDPSNKDIVFSVFGWTPIHWDFDFGTVQPISAIRLYSNRPEEACEGILVLGSRDGEKWFRITDLATPEHITVRDGGRIVYADNSVRTNAKMLKVSLMRRRLPTTLFFDEMEVVKAAQEWRPDQLVETPVKSAQTAIEDALTKVGAHNRLHDDAAALRKILADSPALLKKLDGIEKKFATLKVPAAEEFSSRFPQNPIHEALFSLFAEHLRTKGTTNLSVWSPYRYVFPNAFAEPNNSFKSLQFNMLRNMSHSELLQLLNSTDKTMAVDCSFEGPEKVLKALELSELPWTDTAESIPVSTILLPLPLNGKLQLLPGLTTRLWLTVDSAKLAAGKYSVNWRIGGNAYPVNIEVHDVAVSTPRLMAGSWDYSDNTPSFGITEGNVASAIALMDKMHINTPWIGGDGVRFPTAADFDDDCNFIGKIDTSHFEAWVKSRPDKPMYCCFINNEADVRMNIGGHKMGTEKFTRCAANWIRAWDKRMQDIGMTPGRVQWLLVDEVTNDHKMEIQVAWSRAFKAANPKVLRNWNDPLIDVKDPKYKEMLDLIDSLCLPSGIQFNEADWKVYKAYQDSGKKLWSYLCNGPSRLFDPFSYYRMHGLCAWRDNIVGIGFWSFGDCGSAKTFNEYTLSWAIFSPACFGKDKVYSTLALEAFREGIEENEILQMLEERLPSFPAERRQRAEKLLADFRAYIAANIQIHIKWYDAAEKVDHEKADWFIAQAISLLCEKQ